jgi:hypothetical protein
MSKFSRAALLSAFVATVGFFGAATNANASLIISSGGTTLVSSADNSSLVFNGDLGTFNINNIFLLGATAIGGSGTLFDVHSTNVSSSGAGLLTLQMTETNLSAGSLASFGGLFTGQFSNMTVSRSFYLDTGNTGALKTLIGSTTAGDGAFSYNSALTGLFSLTEVITLTATGPGSFLSSDDAIRVPEPMSLGLLGAGLAGIGLIRRRRANAA